MSRPADVVAVLDRAIDTAALVPDLADSLKQTRSAVAELIAADEEYDAAEAEYVAHDKSLFKRDKAWYVEWERMEARCDAAIARRAAALAAVRGEA